MNKILLIALLGLTMVMAKPINKGGVHSNLKGANSVVKPNKLKKYDKKYDKNYNKINKHNNVLDNNKKIDRKVKNNAIRSVR